MIVTTAAGSYVVVYKNPQHYLDARKHRRLDMTYIELVKSGQVYFREFVMNINAPERIVQLMKEYLL